MYRWNNLWLSEGFARYMEYIGTDFYKSNWKSEERLFYLILNIIQADSTDDTRKLSMTVNTPEEIDATYNPTITYGKVK